MNSMTSGGPQANTVCVAAPHYERPVIPGSMTQVPQYPLNQPQVQIISGNPPGVEPPVYTQLDKRSFEDGKVLGALQILIGLLHIGLGIILGTLIAGQYTSVSFYGGYPFWAGIWFIISGSLSVASEHLLKSSCLLKGSLGLNIVSAICSLIGIMLLISELIMNPLPHHYPSPNISWGTAPGVATSAVLFLFNLLELSIACTASVFGCQRLGHARNRGPRFFQTIFTNPEPVNTPPHCLSAVQGS